MDLGLHLPSGSHLRGVVLHTAALVHGRCLYPLQGELSHTTLPQSSDLN